MNPKLLKHHINHMLRFWALIHFHNRTRGKLRIAKKVLTHQPITPQEFDKLIS